MREIKFRGETDSGVRIFGGITADRKNIMIPSEEKGYFLHIPVKPESVSQFTGFLDSTQKEIYEHDRIQVYFCRNIRGKLHHFVTLYEVRMFPELHLCSLVSLNLKSNHSLPISFLTFPDVQCFIVDHV